MEVTNVLVAVKLDDLHAFERLEDVEEFLDRTIDEQSNHFRLSGEGRGDLGPAFSRDESGRGRMEIQADPVGPGLGAGQGFSDVGQSAHLDADWIQDTPSLDSAVLNLASVLTPT